MKKQERINYILDYLQDHEKISTQELVEKFSCTEDTIRKDFQILAAQGLVKRYHGGVKKAENGVILYEDRSISHLDEKKQLANAIIPYLLDKKMIFVDGGTTNQLVIEALPRDFAGVIVTNAIPIASVLCDFPNVEGIFLGGNINKKLRNTEGTISLSQLSHFNFDCYLMGVSNISLKDGVTFPLLSEASLKKEAISKSKDVFVALTQDKFDTVTGFYAAEVSQITTLFTTDKREDIIKKYQESGVTLVKVAPSD